MVEALGFMIGLGIGLIVGLVITFLYLKFKVARITANAQAAAIDYAAGKIKDIGKDVIKNYLKKRNGTEQALG